MTQPDTSIVVDFNPRIETIGHLPEFSMEEIRGEPMLFTCDMEYTRKNCGPITTAFLNAVGLAEYIDIIPSGLHVVMDCRTTMTFPGMYPSIPGWHCDDFNRSEKYGQPSLDDRDKRIKHAMAIVGEGDGVSRTEFITEACAVPVDPADVWHSLDKAIETDFQHLKRRYIANREVITFSQESIHRATNSLKHGWRWFGRISLTYRKPQNEIRKQVQVYIDKNGW